MIKIVAATISTPPMVAIVPIRMTTKRVGASSIDKITTKGQLWKFSTY